MRRLRSLCYILVAAALGAVIGRLAFQARERLDAGEPIPTLDIASAQPRMQDVIPGLVAAFRVQDAPWSWFHIPGWMAAFVVNAAVGAVGGDFASIRERVERIAFEFAGLDARDFGLGGSDDRDEPSAPYEPATDTAWTAPPPPPASPPPPPPSPSFGNTP